MKWMPNLKVSNLLNKKCFACLKIDVLRGVFHTLSAWYFIQCPAQPFPFRSGL